MNHCGIHQNNTFASSCEEMRSSVSVSVSFDKGGPMICPKPKRLSLFANNAVNDPVVRPIRLQMCYQSEGWWYGGSDHTSTQVASLPPFFSGSPPSRVSNLLIQDARFGDEKITPMSPRTMVPNPVVSSSSPSSSARKCGCLQANFGNKTAVRVEGFDCLDRDNRRN